MTMDIFQHQYVPPHEILPKKDARELLNMLGIEKEKLPKIFVSDPVAKKIDAKSGDIIKILRKSPTAGKTTYYRVVV